MHERLDKIGLPVPPRAIDSRIPKLWLTKPLLSQDDSVTKVYNVYLVNSSGTTLETVIVDSGGWLYDDDDLFTTSQTDDIEYYNVENGDAVKVFAYSPFHDSDWITWLSIKVKVKMKDKWIEFSTTYNRNTNRVDEDVLL